MLDCLIVGGGPAGLMAAVYLGRFRRRVIVVDGGWSRAEWITQSHNLAGFPEGIAGTAFLERMRQQARLYGAILHKGYVDRVELAADTTFVAHVENTPDTVIAARRMILATGVVENKPPVPHLADAVRHGLIRTCPICDGYESRGKRIAVLGNGPHAAAEALFLRTYTNDLTVLLVQDTTPVPPDTRAALAAAGIAMHHVGAGSVCLTDDGSTALYAEDGQTHSFDIIYTAFGTTPQTALAKSLNTRLNDAGRLYVGEHQETSVSGLFAAGDLVRGLNQISVAAGEAAIAATAVHNSLAKVSAERAQAVSANV